MMNTYPGMPYILVWLLQPRHIVGECDLAVAFLIFISVILQQKQSRIISNITSQVYLAILLIPVSVYYFGGFSAVSIVANLVAIPLVSFIIVPLLFVSLAFSLIGVKIWFVANMFLTLLCNYLSLLTKHVILVSYWSYFSTTSLI